MSADMSADISADMSDDMSADMSADISADMSDDMSADMSWTLRLTLVLAMHAKVMPLAETLVGFHRGLTAESVRPAIHFALRLASPGGDVDVVAWVCSWGVGLVMSRRECPRLRMLRREGYGVMMSNIEC